MTGVKLATNVALIAVKGTWALNNFRSFFISTDNGASFTQCGSFAGQFATTTAWTSGFLQAPDGSIIAPVARTFATATWNLELWRGVFNGSNDVAWESVSALVSLSPIECDAFALNNNSFALDAPPVTEEEEPTPALTGRNDMLVLSSTTGKWTSYSLS